MKVWVLFKVKDIQLAEKEYIIDSIHTTLTGAMVRENRIHNYALGYVPNHKYLGTTYAEDMAPEKELINLHKYKPHRIWKTPNQETYIINKSLKGEIK